MKNLIKKIFHESLFSRFRRKILQPESLVIITIILFVGLVVSGQRYFSNRENNNGVDAEERMLKEVSVATIDFAGQNEDVIKTVGSVKANTQVDIVALGSGNINGLFFEVGDNVEKNKILAQIHSSQAITNFANSQINYNNLKNSLESTRRIADESIRQAELNVQSATESVMSAEIALSTAQTNLENAKEIQEKTKSDRFENAVISFYNYLNTINTSLDQINYIIKAEGSDQIDGISETLGVKNIDSLKNAKASYYAARDEYNQISGLKPTNSTISVDMKKLVFVLEDTKVALDDTITVLENTVASVNFSETSLNTQKTTFSANRSNVVNTLTSAETILQSLENVDLLNKQELDVLENAVRAAESQLEIAQISKNNADIGLSSAQKAKDQQLISVQTSLDNASGQMNLSGTQVSDLTVKAPIDGQITAKYVEFGTEVAAGTRMAEISQTEMLIIELSLPSEDIYRVKVGQVVNLGDEGLIGSVKSIDPAADPITKKVRMEILFDNKDHQLITGTFIDVFIPVDKLNKTHETAVYIPLRAVTITQNENVVFVARKEEDGSLVAEKREVIVGNTEGVLVEILGGLNDGDQLVVDGAKNLEDRDGLMIIN